MSNGTGTGADDRGLFEGLVADGFFPLALTGVALAGAGGFALFLSATGHFLPHDVAYLGLDAAQLSRAGNQRLVNFMFHDRAAFGGSLLAVGLFYLWLTEFPLRRGEGWAWWTLALSGASGFGSFLSYLGYGYLDTWHGLATLVLLPVFVIGMIRTRRTLQGDRSWRVLFRPPAWGKPGARLFWGRALLLTYGGGLVAAGITISFVGMTTVFVDTDLNYIGLTRLEICGVSDRLLPVIAHDRAGFGGGLLSIGLMVIVIVRHAAITRSFLQVMLLSGGAGFLAAIGVHFAVGYLNLWHLAPAIIGAGIFFTGWLLTWSDRVGRVSRQSGTKVA
ncbi:MAG: hypothetical protein JWM32_2932 [Verrucomicrobia bacterium]|nr:hypothetical protein [Verrucomicrobiota bacterium]